MATPLAIILGGPNGAGKPTFAAQLLPQHDGPIRFINADEIQAGAETDVFAAGRMMLERIDAAVEAGESFAVETTLASRRYVRAIAEWKARGYFIVLHFIELPSADYAILRVRRRVAAGGHHIPDEDVRRRFDRGLALSRDVYQSRVDRCYHWRSDESGLAFISQTDA